MEITPSSEFIPVSPLLCAYYSLSYYLIPMHLFQCVHDFISMAKDKMSSLLK